VVVVYFEVLSLCMNEEAEEGFSNNSWSSTDIWNRYL